jgi:hypothetical protein
LGTPPSSGPPPAHRPGPRRTRGLTDTVDVNSKTGFGANKRTAEFGGGAIGALLDGIFGGGKGAGIGAATSAAGGLLTQGLTRGKQVKIPAESSLTFRLEPTLIARPTRN